MDKYGEAIEILENLKFRLAYLEGNCVEVAETAISALKNEKRREELIDKLLEETKNLDRNSYRYRERYYAIDRLDECEVDDD